MKFLATLLFILISTVSQATTPQWVQTAPQASNRVYGVGLATITTSDAKAIDIASQAARFEVLARLKSTVQGSTNIQTSMAIQRGTDIPTSASQSQRINVIGTTSVEANDLPGMIIEERYIDQSARTAYVLAYLDVVIAEKATKDRLAALNKEWESCKLEENQPVLLALQSLRNLQKQVFDIENVALLLVSAGTDTALREEVQNLRLNISGRLSTLQRQVKIGLSPNSSLPSDLKNLFRGAVRQVGLFWSDENPTILLDLIVSGSQQSVNVGRRSWVDLERRSDFVGLRLALSCNICDVEGNSYGAFDINVKGVGTDELSAKRSLFKEVNKILPDRLKENISKIIQ